MPIETPRYFISLTDQSEVSITKGNNKIGKGVYNISLLPGETPLRLKDGTLLTDIPGTCAGVCDGCTRSCYAVRDAKLHNNVCIPAWGKNTLLARTDLDLYFLQVHRFLLQNKVKIFRWHVSGEIESYAYLAGMIHTAQIFPDITFCFYTKRFDLVAKAYGSGNVFPKNLVCNLSEWHDNIPAEVLKLPLNRFIYDDGFSESYKTIQHCPAVNSKGHRTEVTCDQCLRCYRNTGKPTCVYPH